MLRTLRLEAEMPRFYFRHELAVIGSMAQVFLPFTILALYRGFVAVPLDTMRAARSLGASPARVFWAVVLPQTVQPALASVAVVFGLALGAYVTVVLIGGRRVRLLAGLAFQESTSLLHWQVGAVGLIAVVGGLYALVRWLTRAREPEV
jgi:putative spermidine/putrescine transport system permease protein